MRVIAHSSQVFSRDEFASSVSNDPFINGLGLNIIMTRDKQIVIYPELPNNIVTIDQLQSSTFEQLQDFKITALRDVLEYFKNYNKMMIFNLIPSNQPPLTEQTIADINHSDYEYASTVAQIVDNYPDLNIYLLSDNQNIVQHLKNTVKTAKVGIGLTLGNYNYIDVDFYELPTNMLDLNIITQQIRLGKEIIVRVRNCDDIVILLRYFRKFGNNLSTTSVFNEIIFNSNYPQILYLTFR